MSGFDWPWEVAAGAAAVYLVAGTVKGAIGFALPLVSIALLPFLLPVEMALALNAVVLFAINLLQVRDAGEPRAAFTHAWPVVAGMVVMVPVGAVFAAQIPKDVLMLTLGVFVFAFAVWSLFNPGFAIPEGARQRVGVAMGLVSGVVGALTSAPGPIFVSYVVGLGLPRRLYMGTLGWIMCCFGAMLGVSYVAVGLIGWREAALGLVCLPPALVGFRLGNRLGDRVSPDLFRRAVLSVLALLALLMIHRALG